MNWKNVNILVALLLVGLGFYFFGFKKPNVTNVPAVFNPLNGTYMIEKTAVTLENGKAEASVSPNSATKVSTMAFGEPVRGDLNGDGVSDATLILAQNSGGSGTFYYVVAALNIGNAVLGTNAIFLGDRIAPQTLEVRNGQIIANYAERKQGEPMTTQPSMGVSKYLNVVNGALVEGKPISGIGERCGGNMTTAPVCITGSRCAPDPKSHLPFGDVGGTCARN